MLENLTEAEIREACRIRLEALERWLRRLAHERFSKIAVDYLVGIDPATGNRIIKAEIAKAAIKRRETEPKRFTRGTDALHLDELIAVICHPQQYDRFKEPLRVAFPQGREVARETLLRLVAPRNALAHATAISIRQAERVICYSGDVIDSLKEYYSNMGSAQEYDVPTILRVTDSFGNSFERSQLPQVHDGGIGMFLHNECALHPGDVLTVEIDIDPSFDREEYSITWTSTKPKGISNANSTKVSVLINDTHVGQRWNLQCRVVSNRSWHRMQGGWDDFLLAFYKVLPPG